LESSFGKINGISISGHAKQKLKENMPCFLGAEHQSVGMGLGFFTASLLIPPIRNVQLFDLARVCL
jgi:hypothetical protein